jgi:hypothetical protein
MRLEYIQYKLIIIYLQVVMLLRIIKDKRVYVWQDDANEETKQTQDNGKLQKVKRNRAETLREGFVNSIIHKCLSKRKEF